MAKIFLSYRFTVENPAELEGILSNIKGSLKYAGHDVFCSFEQNQEYCLDRIESCQIFMPFIKSNEKNKGMKMESNKAMDYGKKYVLLIKEGLDHYEFRNLADRVLEYKHLQELYASLKKFK